MNERSGKSQEQNPITIFRQTFPVVFSCRVMTGGLKGTGNLSERTFISGAFIRNLNVVPCEGMKIRIGRMQDKQIMCTIEDVFLDLESQAFNCQLSDISHAQLGVECKTVREAADRFESIGFYVAEAHYREDDGRPDRPQVRRQRRERLPPPFIMDSEGELRPVDLAKKSDYENLEDWTQPISEDDEIE